MKTDRSMQVPSSPSRVWRALTDMAEFGKWFAVEQKSGKFAPGERIDLICTTPEYKGVEFYLIVDEMLPEHLLTWRWHPGIEKPGEDFSIEPFTTVQFELTPEDGGTRVHLTESGFDQLPVRRAERAYKENDEGWAYMMKSLEGHLSKPLP